MDPDHYVRAHAVLALGKLAPLAGGDLLDFIEDTAKINSDSLDKAISQERNSTEDEAADVLPPDPSLFQSYSRDLFLPLDYAVIAFAENARKDPNLLLKFLRIAQANHILVDYFDFVAAETCRS